MQNVNICDKVWEIPIGSNKVSTNDKSHKSEEETRKNEDIKENKDEPKPYQIILKSSEQYKKEEDNKNEIDDYFPEKKDSDLEDIKRDTLDMPYVLKAMNKENPIQNKEEEDKEEKKKKKDKAKKKIQKKEKDEMPKGKVLNKLNEKDNIKDIICPSPNKNKLIGKKIKSSRKKLKKIIKLKKITNKRKSQSNDSYSKELKEFDNIADFRLIENNNHNDTDDESNNFLLTNLNINRSHREFAEFNFISDNNSNNGMNHYQINENTNSITTGK